MIHRVYWLMRLEDANGRNGRWEGWSPYQSTGYKTLISCAIFPRVGARPGVSRIFSVRGDVYYRNYVQYIQWREF